MKSSLVNYGSWYITLGSHNLIRSFLLLVKPILFWVLENVKELIGNILSFYDVSIVTNNYATISFVLIVTQEKHHWFF
jgi:hypothetical protein